MAGWNVVSEEPLPAVGGAWKVVGEQPLPSGGGVGDWAGTRAVNAASSFAGTGRGLSDIITNTAQALGVSPQIARAAVYSNPVTAAGQFLPTTEDFKKAIGGVAPIKETNLPGQAGRVFDAGVESVLQAPALPGSIARNLVTAFVGGASGEAAGSAAQGTPWEPLARLVGGVLGGGTAAVSQNAGGSLLKGLANLLMSGGRNTDKQAASIIGRAVQNDATTVPALLAEHQAFPTGTPVAVAGGENVRGALRGSVVAPGPARTTAANAFDDYRAGGDARVAGAIDERVSNLPPLAIREHDLATQRAAASTPAYEAAGIPSHPALRPQFAIDQPREWNSRIVTSPAIESLLKDSPDIQQAINAARRLPEYKDVPTNAMTMLDKAYKHLNGMEQEAIRAGNDTRARDLKTLRSSFQEALTDANPEYGRALKAFSEPSKLIDAANLGRSVFAKNVNPQESKRLYAELPQDQQKEFLGGVADWLRTRAANSDRATAAERVWNNSNIRERLKGVLPEEDFAAFSRMMEQEAKGGKVAREIFQGSRTAPMQAEGVDNASQMSGVGMDLLRGRFGSAALGTVKGLTGRITEGRTQAVNDRIAQLLTDPEQLAKIAPLIESQQAAGARTAAGRMGAYQSGVLLPTLQVGGETGPLSEKERRRIAQALMRRNEQTAR